MVFIFFGLIVIEFLVVLRICFILDRRDLVLLIIVLYLVKLLELFFNKVIIFVKVLLEVFCGVG